MSGVKVAVSEGIASQLWVKYKYLQISLLTDYRGQLTQGSPS